MRRVKTFKQFFAGRRNNYENCQPILTITHVSITKQQAGEILNEICNIYYFRCSDEYNLLYTYTMFYVFKQVAIFTEASKCFK